MDLIDYSLLCALVGFEVKVGDRWVVKTVKGYSQAGSPDSPDEFPVEVPSFSGDLNLVMDLTMKLVPNGLKVNFFEQAGEWYASINDAAQAKNQPSASRALAIALLAYLG